MKQMIRKIYYLLLVLSEKYLSIPNKLFCFLINIYFLHLSLYYIEIHFSFFSMTLCVYDVE